MISCDNHDLTQRYPGTRSHDCSILIWALTMGKHQQPNAYKNLILNHNFEQFLKKGCSDSVFRCGEN